MRLIIAGSRSITDQHYDAMKAFIYSVLPQPPSEIVSGGARGPDQMGERFAAEHNLPVKQFIPDWDGKGKGAGFLRNGDMAVYASDVPGSMLVALYDGQSKGTAQMIEVARNYGLTVHVMQVNAQPLSLIGVKDITPPTPYIFPQSYSSLNVFDTCPRQYEAKYITKEVPYVQSPEAAWGDQVHNQLENYLKAGGQTVLPGNMAMYKPMADWVLNRAAQYGGQILAERQSAVDAQHNAVPYKSKARWMGGKIDVTIIYPQSGTAEVFDWKTGKVKNDHTQLQMYAALALADYPEVETVGAGYIWLMANQISPPVYFQRADYAQHWDTFDHKYARLKDAYTRGVFQPKPGGLCRKYCGVTACEFHGTGR